MYKNKIPTSQTTAIPPQHLLSFSVKQRRVIPPPIPNLISQPQTCKALRQSLATTLLHAAIRRD